MATHFGAEALQKFATFAMHFQLVTQEFATVNFRVGSDNGVVAIQGSQGLIFYKKKYVKNLYSMKLLGHRVQGKQVFLRPFFITGNILVLSLLEQPFSVSIVLPVFLFTLHFFSFARHFFCLHEFTNLLPLFCPRIVVRTKIR